MLLIVNFFINYLLLALTAKLTKRRAVTWRLVLAAAGGAAYALMIFAALPQAVLAVTKVLSAALIVLVAFRFERLKSYCLSLLFFLFSGLVFLGVTVGLSLLLKPQGMVIRNATVYFDIGARALLGCALAAYLVSCLVVRLRNRRVAANELYLLTAYKDGVSISFLAFADTGNRLREPFSGAPVIVAGGEDVRRMAENAVKRFIPASTVSGTAVLEAFRPDKLVIHTAAGDETLDNVYIAYADDIKKDRCSAVFNPEILSV